MPYKDKDKQREANRLAKQKQRQGMTPLGVTQTENVIPPVRHIHKDRARDLLDHWADGGGTPRQRPLGILNKQYDVIKGGHPKSILPGYVTNARDVV